MTSYFGRTTRLSYWCLLLALLFSTAVEAATPGSFYQHFVSLVDGSQQYYGIYVPTSYVNYAKHPVIFIGHGFNGAASNSFSSYQQSFANTHGWLLVQLQGRGNTFYDGIAETDFFEVLADMKTRYTLDEDRFYFEGASMGATGAFHFGIRFPHVFAAVGGCDGFADYRAWYEEYYTPDGAPTEIAPCRIPNLLMASCVDTAERAKWQHCWITVDQLDTSVWPANGINLHAALDAFGAATLENDYANSYNLVLGGGHCAGYNESAMYPYFLSITNNRYPAHVVITTNRLRYGAEYWASINRLQTANIFGKVDAVLSGNAVTVTTSNVLALTLTLDANVVNTNSSVSITVDGLPAYQGAAGTITLYARRDLLSGAVTGWGTTDLEAAKIWKRAGLEGPIGDAYTSYFTVCYGSAGTEEEVQANQAEAQRFCDKWALWMGGTIVPIAENNLTPAEIAAGHVILFGAIESSTLLQGMQGQLPLLVHDGGVTIGNATYTGNYGAYFVYPNPQNPAKYLVVSHGTILVPQVTSNAWLSDPKACAKDLEALPWYWPDYVVFRTDITPRATVQPKLAYLPDAFVVADYFDVNWQLAPPPSITSITPGKGGIGATITLSGTNFSPISSVQFNGIAATFVVVNATTLTTTVPAGAGSGKITLTTPLGSVTSAALFTVIPPPAITAFTPSSGVYYTVITLTGTNFISPSSVQFNGTKAIFSWVNATTITAKVPGGATSGPITVTTPGGTATSSTNFTILFPPTLTSVTPNSGIAGVTVTLTGTNLATASAVQFNGISATFSVLNATTITAKVPAGAGNGKITVTTPGGTASSMASFTVNPPATITSFAPSSALAYTVVTITGANFNSPSSVKFNGTAAIFIWVNNTTITAKVPAGASSGPLTVTMSSGTATSTTNFTVLLPPTLTSITPNSGAAGTTVTLTGTNLATTLSVHFNGVAATFSVVNATTITAKVPAGAGNGKITVTTPGGTAGSASNFTVNPPPTITSFTPSNALAYTVVTITGANFNSPSSVKFNGSAAIFIWVNNTTITAKVPAGASSGPITVTTPSGTATSTGNFTVR